LYSALNCLYLQHLALFQKRFRVTGGRERGELWSRRHDACLSFEPTHQLTAQLPFSSSQPTSKTQNHAIFFPFIRPSINPSVTRSAWSCSSAAQTDNPLPGNPSAARDTVLIPPVSIKPNSFHKFSSSHVMCIIHGSHPEHHGLNRLSTDLLSDRTSPNG